MVEGGSELHECMHQLSQEALRLTAIINSAYHPPQELRTLFAELIGQPVDENFGLFPPFTVIVAKTSHWAKEFSLILAAASKTRAVSVSATTL